MLYSGILTAFLAFPLFANAFHNVTYNDNDPAVVYRPAADWIDWPPAGCLSWPGGQYTHNAAGSITLQFYGVAVYAYGLFDDPTNPIYTIQVDNDNAVELGRGTNANPQSCDPIYSKTGLAVKNHTITLQMTDTRPGDVQDLSFQGFIVTVPDAGDAPTTTNTNTNSSSNDSSKQPPIGIIAAAAGGVAIVCFALAVFCFCRRKNRKSNIASQQMTGSAVPLVAGGYNQPPVDPSIPAPTPYILPPSREASPYYPPTSVPWSPASNEQQSYYGGSSSGPSQVQSHVSYAPSGGYSSPSPSNDGYGRPYGTQTTPVNGGQPFYPNPANPGFYGDAQQQQQHNPAQNQYQTPVQQQSQYNWNPPVSAPPGLAQSEVSYLSREEGSSSAARTEEPHHPSPSVRYTKGAVDHNAAPVVRNENTELQSLGPKRESHGGEAPPPEYGAF